MSRSYFKIKDLTKEGSLSGEVSGSVSVSKSGLALLLRTTIETFLRVLSVGLFIYCTYGDMDPLIALALYYTHVCIMVIFNIIFNTKKINDIDMNYALDILFNSLSCQFTYAHCNFRNILDMIKVNDKPRDESHQPSAIRQTLYYLLIITENAALCIGAVLSFHNKKQDGVLKMNDGYGGEFPFTAANLTWTIVSIGVLQLVVFPISLFIFYATHPSKVSLTSFRPKCQIYILGKKYRFLQGGTTKVHVLFLLLGSSGVCCLRDKNLNLRL
jgi:hypothetical protein